MCVGLGLGLVAQAQAQTATTTASATQPTCGLAGYDSGSELAYYGDSATALYSSYSACNTLCTSNTNCLSFAIDPSVACILYSAAAESNVVVSSGSPWTFYDRGGVCPLVAPTSSVVTPTATPTCAGLVGYDAGGTNIGYYSDAVSITYGGCLAQCNANTACLSFGLTGSACILYPYAVEGNDIASPGSGNTFYDAGGACAATSTVAATSTAPAATPTCAGLVGYDAGGTNIGYYADAASATYGGCYALCQANAACLSFGLTAGPACILYDYTVEGNDIASPGSGNTFYDAGGACPTTTATATSVTTPVQTGAFANVRCPPFTPPPPPSSCILNNTKLIIALRP